MSENRWAKVESLFAELANEFFLALMPPTYKEFMHALSQMYKTIDKETDRGSLLVGLALIEERLGKLLLAALTIHGPNKDADWLLNPEAGNRPLGTLAVRTRMARCLGLLDEDVLQVIDSLRKLRNNHAHGTAKFVVTENDMQPITQAWSDKHKEAVDGGVNQESDDPSNWNNYSTFRKQLIGSVAVAAVCIELDGYFQITKWKAALSATQKKTPAD